MGSATIIDNTTTMAEDKKNTLKSIIKNIKCKLGLKKDKEIDKKENRKEVKDVQKEIRDKGIEKEKEQALVDDVLNNFKKLELANSKEKEQKKEKDEAFKTEVDNKVEKITYKVIEEDRNRSESIQSHSSGDSGFSDKTEDDKSIEKEDDDVIENSKDTGVENKENELTKKEQVVVDSLKNLKIEDGKKRKPQLVPVPRGPTRHRTGALSGGYHPYGLDTQINHTINKHTLSGGQVIVANRTQEFAEVPVSFKPDLACDDLQTFSDDLALRGVQLDGQPFDLDLVQEYLDETEGGNDILQEFLNDPNCSDHMNTITNIVQNHIEAEQNTIEELENTNHLNYEKIENLDSLLGFQEVDKLYTNIYPTPPSIETAHSPSNNEFYGYGDAPPRSDTISSPVSDSTWNQTSDCVLSPNSDCENYQEIHHHYEEFPTLPEDITNTPESDTDKKARERNTSTSSLSMKNYKDMQKELAATFSKKECCQMNRKPCKEIFQMHMKKLNAEERKNMSLKVSSMDLKTIYGVLHHILLGLCRGDVDEDLHLALFAVLGEKVLGTKPQLFLEDFGLSLLKAASLRCPQRPLLVRYLVQCVRAAARLLPTLVESKEYLFKEVDAAGDTLVTACARAGDACADVLSELVRREHDEKPLFNVQHTNTEGYSALHVACREHRAASRRLHVVHVLLEHGGADIWKGDVKGGDGAVHMAVNSAGCELRLVLLLFRHLERKQWKRLAHAPNRSSVTPLDYARCAAKSSTRANYPPEVLEFLKKCR